MTQDTDYAAALRPCVMRYLADEAAQAPLTSRQDRAIEIACGLQVRVSGRRGRWKVQSQTNDKEYAVGDDWCSCPDDRCHPCKHVLAVRYLIQYIETLLQRTTRGQDWRDAQALYPDADVAQIVESLEQQYIALLLAAASYQPPAETLLYSLRIEAIGDDAIQSRRMCQRAGVMWLPKSVKQLRPQHPWAAQILGLCPRYEFRREFVRGQKDYRSANKLGSRGVYVYYQLPPGLFEIQEIVDFNSARRYFARVVDHKTIREIDRSEVLRWLTQT